MTSRSLRGGRAAFPRGTGRVAGAAGLLALALLTALLLVEGLERTGLAVALLPLLAAVFVLLVLHPRFTLALVFGANLALESDREAFLTQYNTFYAPLPTGVLEPTDILLAALAAGVLLDLARRDRPLRIPEALALPLLLFCAAVGIGLIGGVFGDADMGALATSTRTLAYLVVLPLAVFNLLQSRRELTFGLALAAWLLIYKSVTGLVGWLIGVGRSVEGGVLTYYSPAPNFALLTFVLAAAGATLARIRIPLMVWLCGPLAAVVLILSFRRNFYLALVVGVALLVLVVTGQKGRALLIPAAATLAIAFWLGIAALGGAQSSSPIIGRVQSLSPTRIEANAYDRYRLDEFRNIREEIIRHPVTGLGLGVPWSARYPLAVAFPGGRDYVHGTVLWFWLKLGVVGVLAYLALMLASVRIGLRVWRDAPKDVIGVAALALALALVGLMVAETTGAFVGVSARLTVLVGIAIGWLAAADALNASRQARAP